VNARPDRSVTTCRGSPRYPSGRRAERFVHLLGMETGAELDDGIAAPARVLLMAVRYLPETGANVAQAPAGVPGTG